VSRGLARERSFIFFATSVINAISDQGKTALPYGFGWIAGDFAGESSFCLLLNEKFNECPEGKPCALADFER
jgi:hypothetical protein